MKYKEQLRTEMWQVKRNVILKRDKYKCVECSSTESLQAHHTYYQDGKFAWEYPNKALKTLCKVCHNKFHDTHRKIKVNDRVLLIAKNISVVPKKKFISTPTKYLIPGEIDLNVIPMEPGTIIIKNEDKVLTACSFIQITDKAKTCKTNIQYTSLT